MDKEKVLNLALLFDKDISKKLEDYSQKLAQLMPNPCVLGIDSIPHITIAQFINDSIPGDIWSTVLHLTKTPITVELTGLYFDKKSNSQKMNFGIRISPSEELYKLQQDIINLISEEKIVSGKGQRFFPHVTLGFGSAPHSLPVIPFGEEMFFDIQVPAFLALGRTGPEWQYTETIYSSLS